MRCHAATCCQGMILTPTPPGTQAARTHGHPLTIAVPPAQRLSLRAVADVQKTSISAIVRQLIGGELAADVTIVP